MYVIYNYMPRRVGRCLGGTTQGECILATKGERKKEQDRVRIPFNAHRSTALY